MRLSILTLALMAFATLTWPSAVRAEHFDIHLTLQTAAGTTRSSWDTSPPPGGVNPRPLATAVAGEELSLSWEIASGYPHGTMKNVTVTLYVAREEAVGSHHPPSQDAPRALSYRFTTDFLPEHRARGQFHFRAMEPGVFLVRIETLGTAEEHGHEHFSAIDLQVLAPAGKSQE